MARSHGRLKLPRQETLHEPFSLLDSLDERLRVSVEFFPDPVAYDAIVPLGSKDSVADPAAAFVPGERAFVRHAVDARVPVLGICFRGQLLASALGGEVRRADMSEVGWCELDVQPHVPIATGPWFQWHVDRSRLGRALPEGSGFIHASSRQRLREGSPASPHGTNVM